MSEEIKQEEVKVDVEKEEVIKEKSMVKKVFGWIGTGLLTLLVVMASWLCFDKFVLKHRVPSIFGYSSLIVSTGSMNGFDMNEGDLSNLLMYALIYNSYYTDEELKVL